jgi:hypothetical protein
MTITRLQEIAAEYWLSLIPTKVTKSDNDLRSHILWLDKMNKGHYPNMQLEAMTEAEFRAICKTAASLTPVTIDPDMRAAELESRKPRRRLNGQFNRMEKIR